MFHWHDCKTVNITYVNTNCKTCVVQYGSMDKPILMQICTSDPWVKCMKWSSLGSGHQRSTSHEAEDWQRHHY